MSQAEWFTTYLEYETLKDMLKVILYTSQSFMSITPLLYYINYQDRDILFIHGHSRRRSCPLSYSR